jgi:hypothetical protein
MTNMSEGMTLAEFERLLDVYGGARTRWPAEARAAAAQLVARDAKARRLLAEAEALDRLLERAPLPSLAVEAALAERIVSAAQRSPRLVRTSPGGATVVPLPTGNDVPREPVPSLSRTRRLLGADVRAAAVLAASLVIGVFIGISNVPQRVVPQLATAVGDQAGYSMAQVEPFDEDVL